MPVTSQPTDQPYGQLITDEQTLERLFRANYEKWLADAKRRLGADGAAAAPRVVSKAFHLAWQDRKRFHSQEELDAFLGANIQHGAARELSRRAGLHRMDAHSAGGAHKEAAHDHAEMTVDEAWDRLQHTLKGGAPDAYRARASTARHEAAAHVAGLAKERNWKPFAIIGVVGLALAVGAIMWINKAGESRAVDHALAASNVRSYETSYGQQLNVTLDDSTIVRLGPESRLTIPQKFGMTGGYRAVKIDGTADFNVTRTLSAPFDVRAGNIAIVAHGTQFTVKRFRGDSSTLVYVRDGTVEVRYGENQTRPVAKGAALIIADNGAPVVPSQEQQDEATSWVDGNVTIVGHNLRYVIPQLKRWYGLDIHVENTALLDRPVFVRAAMNSPKEAITSVEQSGGLKFTYIGENMAFQDTTAAPAKAAPKAGTKAAAKPKTGTKRK
jgi:ferric-dicitrate binding protein FerR (iron transport regulator)